MAARKVLTRAESQAQTRQALLDSAEQLFYANGYHATSIAAIAAEAGRTIGAVYSNFDGKEALCLEVLRNRLLSEMTKLFDVLVTAGDSLDARSLALSSWWSQLSTETSLVLVTAEYVTSTFKDESRVTNNREVVEGVKAVSRAVFEDTLPDTVSKTDPMVNDAVDALVSTGAGLAVTQAMGVIDAEHGARLMVATLRMWLERISDQPGAAHTS